MPAETVSKPIFTIQTYEERESFRLKRQQKEEQYAANMNQERVLLAVKERDLRLERDKQDMTEAERELTRLVHRQQSSIPLPPPLPPVAIESHQQLSKSSLVSPLESNLPPLPPYPPDCPTPDYDRASLASEPAAKTSTKISSSHSSTNNSRNGNADFVEMQSIESFKLTNPLVSKPKPPPIYFKPKMNGSTSTSSISSRSVEALKPTVTIREYPQNQDRRQPEKFQFLSSQGNVNGVTNYNNNDMLTARLQNELSQTLSRVNLGGDHKVSLHPEERATQMKRPGKNTVTISINAQTNGQNKQEGFVPKTGKHEPFYLHLNGNSNTKNNHEVDPNRDSARKISTTVLNQTFTNKNGIKIEDISSKSSVSFNLNHAKDKTDSKIVTVIPTNGILKNGVGGSLTQMQIDPSQPYKSPTKSIKFAGISIAENHEPKK